MALSFRSFARPAGHISGNRARTLRVRRDANGREWVIGWDEEQTWNDEIRNYTGKPMTLELRLRFNGNVDFRSEAKTTVFDYRTVETKLAIAEGKTCAYPYSVTIHHGANAKQTRVKLVGK